MCGEVARFYWGTLCFCGIVNMRYSFFVPSIETKKHVSTCFEAEGRHNVPFRALELLWERNLSCSDTNIQKWKRRSLRRSNVASLWVNLVLMGQFRIAYKCFAILRARWTIPSVRGLAWSKFWQILHSTPWRVTIYEKNLDALTLSTGGGHDSWKTNSGKKMSIVYPITSISKLWFRNCSLAKFGCRQIDPVHIYFSELNR